MAMDLNARAAYIRGLMTGMEFDAASPNGKVIAAMMDLLEQMAAAITERLRRRRRGGRCPRGPRRRAV